MTDLEKQIREIAKAINDKKDQAFADKRDPEKDDKLHSLVKEEFNLVEEVKKQVLADLAQSKADEKRQNSIFNINPLEQNKVGDNSPGTPYSYRGKMAMSGVELRTWHSKDISERIESYQAISDKVYLVGTLLSKMNGMDYYNTVVRTKTFRAMLDMAKSDSELSKAINITTTGEGLELVPTALSGRIIKAFELENFVYSLFQETPMPTNPFESPIRTAGATVYRIGETIADNPVNGDKATATTPLTGKFTMTAIGIGARTLVSYQATEDAIIAVIPFVEAELGEGLGNGAESSILNGDDSGTHMDSDISGTSPVETLFKGLRYFGLNSAGTGFDFSNTAITKLKLESLMLQLKHYASDISNNVLIMGAQAYTKFRMSEIEIFTRDKYNDNAVVLKGELSQWAGMPIVSSKHMREDLNASGVYDGVTTNRGSIILAHRKSFITGKYGSTLVEADRDIQTQQVQIVASKYHEFLAPFDPTNALYPSVSIGYNVLTV